MLCLFPSIWPVREKHLYQFQNVDFGWKLKTALSEISKLLCCLANYLWNSTNFSLKLAINSSQKERVFSEPGFWSIIITLFSLFFIYLFNFFKSMSSNLHFKLIMWEKFFSSVVLVVCHTFMWTKLAIKTIISSTIYSLDVN